MATTLAEQAIRTLVETYFLGVGIGGARASGYLNVLRSNVGILGLCFVPLFVLFVLFARRGGRLPEHRMVVAQASKLAMLSGLMAAITSLTFFEIGLAFYLFAAAAAVLSTAPAPVPLRRHAPRRQPNATPIAARRA